MKLSTWMRGVAANEFIRPYAVRWLQFGLLGQERPAYLTDCWRYPNWRWEAGYPMGNTPGNF